MKISIIGGGRFGKLLQKHLSTDNVVTIDQPQDSELVIFAVPNRNLEAAIAQWKPQISANAIVMDVGSVKEIPCQILQRYFPERVLGTHPLYGPDSAGESWQGHKAVFCRLQIDDTAYNQVKALFTNRGVTVLECTPQQHDAMMAKTQALVHFIGRALDGIQAQDISTPDYANLLKMMEKVTNDTWELFLDMQTLNPQAGAIRAEFVKKLLQVERQVTEQIAEQATELTQLRSQIDRVDDLIVALVGERLAIAKQIGRLKQQQATEVQDASRETQLYIRMHQLAQEYSVPLEVVAHLFDYLMGESRKLQ